MEDEFVTLCIIPNNVWVQPDWSRIGCKSTNPRRMYACLTSICMYSNQKPIPVHNWSVAKKEHAITVQEMHTFVQLKELLSRLVYAEPGMYVYNGMVTASHNHRRPVHSPSDVYQHYHFKTCMNYPGPEYAGSYSTTLDELWGYDPEIGHGFPFTLGWLSQDDPIASKILEEYAQWPDSRCLSLLPSGPSPSEKSVELTGLGEDMEITGIFIDSQADKHLSPHVLRQALGEKAILAKVEVDDFWYWLENDFSLDDLVAYDNPLPFS